MNIFVLSEKIQEAAMWHVDRHVVKMPLESAQMLCTSLHIYGKDSPYKPVHKKHPCTLWAAETRSNFLWLCELGLALCNEFTYRYGKVHGAQDVLKRCVKWSRHIPYGQLTKFAMAMPDEYKNSDAVTAYRNYYRKVKIHLAEWRNREAPFWYYEKENNDVIQQECSVGVAGS